MSKANVELREKLWAKNPHCAKCSVLTIRPEVAAKEHGLYIAHMMGHLPTDVRDRIATLDHLINRFEEGREGPLGGRKKHQLLCQKCNIEKGTADFEALTPEQKHRVRMGWREAVPKGKIENESFSLGDVVKITRGM